ncbi:MAG: hypothetical protein Fur0041_08830 [Bacteroidia bacterium]
MKAKTREPHRLTTLQRQILHWLKMEGGGTLPVDRLFTTMYNNHTFPDTHPELLSERLCEAVEQLIRSGYAEVRDEQIQSSDNISLYDFGLLTSKMLQQDKIWTWKDALCPSVVLTSSGMQYS